jgi:hypothetical protein
MTDESTKTTSYETGASGAATDDSFAWSEPEAKGDAGAKAREWLGQLQAMIENIATQAAPVVREVGAKAAELAALAGDKAGPAAQKAADFTGQAGQKLAVKSRELAGELRRDVAGSKAGDFTSETASDIAETTAEVTSDEPTTTSVA